ncbi:MAG: PKD domain-containing protein, partial [Thermoplasmatota archaeon]
MAVTLNGSGSYDLDGTITNYTWTMGDGTTLYGEEITHTYTTVGNYTVTLTIKDNRNATDSDSCTVEVRSPPPVAVGNASPSEAYTNVDIQFDGTGSYDPDGHIVNWTWDFDDGETGYGNITSHPYDDDGTYSVQLTVRDNDGETNTTAVSVTILNRNPSADFMYSPSNPDTQDSIS